MKIAKPFTGHFSNANRNGTKETRLYPDGEAFPQTITEKRFEGKQAQSKHKQTIHDEIIISLVSIGIDEPSAKHIVDNIDKIDNLIIKY